MRGRLFENKSRPAVTSQCSNLHFFKLLYSENLEYLITGSPGTKQTLLDQNIKIFLRINS